MSGVYKWTRCAHQNQRAEQKIKDYPACLEAPISINLGGLQQLKSNNRGTRNKGEDQDKDHSDSSFCKWSRPPD